MKRTITDYFGKGVCKKTKQGKVEGNGEDNALGSDSSEITGIVSATPCESNGEVDSGSRLQTTRSACDLTGNVSGTTAVEGNGEADSVSSACDLTGNEDKCATGTTATLVKRSTVPHNFQNSWLKKWPWLQLRNGLMYCTTYEKHKKMNGFQNYKYCNYQFIL